MLVRILFSLFSLMLFHSCYKNGLYVQQEWVDASFLASSHVGTPDPRQDCPPCGPRLLVAWRFPPFDGLNMVLRVRFWDNVEEEIIYPIPRRHGTKAFNFFGREILTYRIDIVDLAGEIIDSWEHHFWTKLIDLDPE